MKILDTHNHFKLIADKSGYFSHEDIDILLHMAQLTYFSDLIGSYNKYQPGRAVPPVVYGQTQRSIDSLTPFKTPLDFYNLTDGKLAIPSDYIQLESAQSKFMDGTTYRMRPIMVIDGEQWADRIDSVIVPPTKENAICTFYNGYILFAPTDTSGVIYYFKKPTEPFYKYTLVGRTETHDASGSQDLLWNDVDSNNIILRALRLAGINTADPLLIQTAKNE